MGCQMRAGRIFEGLSPVYTYLPDLMLFDYDDAFIYASDVTCLALASVGDSCKQLSPRS